MKIALDNAQIKAEYISAASTRFSDGIIVTTAQLAKGLEFDRVIVPFVNKSNYKDEIDRSMLYIACTRAMQDLIIIHSDQPSNFIKKNGFEVIPPKQSHRLSFVILA